MRRVVAIVCFGMFAYERRLNRRADSEFVRIDIQSWLDVGYAVGYQDPASFRRLFRRHAGMTTAAYRRRFGGSEPDALSSLCDVGPRVQRKRAPCFEGCGTEAHRT